MKKNNLSHFIGRQLSRLKAGQSYYSIVMVTITALGIVSMAFPTISIILLVILFPLILFGAYLIGYFLDKSNVVTTDHMKTIEMAYRYLNVSDFKANEFNLVLITVVFKWMNAIQNKEPIDFNELKIEYDKFLKKWKSPEDKK